MITIIISHPIYLSVCLIYVLLMMKAIQSFCALHNIQYGKLELRCRSILVMCSSGQSLLNKEHLLEALMGSLISMGDIWFVQALISLLFFFPCPPSLLIQLDAALIILTSASFCFSLLLFSLLFRQFILICKTMSHVVAKDSLFCFSPLSPP